MCRSSYKSGCKFNQQIWYAYIVSPFQTDSFHKEKIIFPPLHFHKFNLGGKVYSEWTRIKCNRLSFHQQFLGYKEQNIVFPGMYYITHETSTACTTKNIKTSNQNISIFAKFVKDFLKDYHCQGHGQINVQFQIFQIIWLPCLKKINTKQQNNMILSAFKLKISIKNYLFKHY